MLCDNFNAKNLLVLICSGFLNEYIGETGVGKTKPKDYARVYKHNIQQPLIWETILAKSPIWSKKGFLGKFHSKEIYFLKNPYHSTKFGIKS